MYFKTIRYVLIISHKHKFIFIKTNKTAGTSIEIALSKFCGSDDIITPIDEKDEKIRQEFGYRGPQNYTGFYNHISAEEIKEKIDKKVWKEYFKFCVERNPWDRFISFYYFKNPKEPRPELSTYIDDPIVNNLKKYGYHNYTINDEIVVDKICLYENLKEDLKEVSKLLELPTTLELPNAKAGFRKDKRPYKEVLSTYIEKKIVKIFSEEIALFNYEF